MKDEIYREPLEKPEKFEFSQKVAAVFDDMIRRSVPYYEANQEMTAQMAQEFYQPGSVIYDLGCSTGKTAEYLKQSFNQSGFNYVGIDNSEPMIAKAKNANSRSQHSVQFILGDIESFSFQNAGVVIANYTFQFIPPDRRQDLLKNIYNGLLQNGVLLLSEKVIEENSVLSTHFVNMHHKMKKAHGYSDLEIIQKRDAIEDVLIPNETSQNLELIKKSGFRAAAIYHKWYNFASYIALK